VSVADDPHAVARGVLALVLGFFTPLEKYS
jgi:hypothetical protein